MKLDVVAELVFQRHVVGEHRNLVAAGVLGGEHRLIRTSEKVCCGVTARNTQCHTDAHRARQRLAVDGHPFAQGRLQAIGQRLRGIGVHRRRRYDDELVATEPGDQVGALGGLLRSRSARTRMNQSPAVWPR